MSNYRACREIGVHPTTGMRWRDGRKMVDSGGRARYYPPIAAPPVVISQARRWRRGRSVRGDGTGRRRWASARRLGGSVCRGGWPRCAIFGSRAVSAPASVKDIPSRVGLSAKGRLHAVGLKKVTFTDDRSIRAAGASVPPASRLPVWHHSTADQPV